MIYNEPLSVTKNFEMETESVEDVKNIKPEKSKKQRTRIKALLKNVKEQMEFYFSDSNLQKDRFIKQEINKTQDGYVELSMFLNFNKIKLMTCDPSIISKAVGRSKKLELNSDETKVKRVTPFVERDMKEIDSRTVYVECLPRNVNHEWIKRVFSECGHVNYVSLPTFRSTGDPKGFGFVEFDSTDAAAKACELLNNPPVELTSRAGRFPRSNKQLEQLQKHEPAEEIVMDADVTEENKTELSPTKLRKRRQRCTSESSVDGSDAPSAKKLKRTSIESLVAGDGKRKSLETSLRSDEESSSTKKKKKKKKKSRKSLDAAKTDEESDVKEPSNQGNQDNKLSIKTESDSSVGKNIVIPQETKSKTESDSDTDKGRKRKRKSSDVIKSEIASDSSILTPQKRKRKLEGSADTSSESDQVEPRKKSRTSVEFSEPIVQELKPLKSDTGTVEGKKKKRRRKKKKEIKEAETLHLRVLPKSEWLDLRKDYLKTQKSKMADLKKKIQHKENQPAKEKTKGDNKQKGIEFVPDVVIKVESRTTLEKKSLREMFNTDINIAYIDVVDGNTSGFIRCKDAASAKSIVNSNLEFYRFNLLNGEEESTYWKKLESDRDNKFNNKTKSKKRGQQKLIERAQKINADCLDKQHVFFED